MLLFFSNKVSLKIQIVFLTVYPHLLLLLFFKMKIFNGKNTILGFISKKVKTNVLKIGSVIESEILPVHGSLVEPVVEPRSDR